LPLPFKIIGKGFLSTNSDYFYKRTIINLFIENSSL